MIRKMLGAVLVAGAMVVGGCGGGSSPRLVAGIEGLGVQSVSVGTITGFGSIFVNGVEFKTTSSTIRVNGASSSESRLRVGQVVTVTGTVNSDGKTGTATTVEFNAKVEGPIASVNVAGSSFIVLGQTVRVDANTSFDNGNGGPLTIADLLAGRVVEVSGFTNAAGDILATRVELQSANTESHISGAVQTVNTNSRQLTVNGVTIDFATATLSNFPSNRNPQAGDLVEVHGGAPSAPSVVTATRIEFRTAVSGGNGNGGEVEGLVSRFASATDFDVNGTKITTDANTQFSGGTAASLALNVRLEVEGKFNTAGVLVATKIEVRSAVSLRVKALVDSVTAASNTLSVFGVSVTTNTNTRFDDKSNNRVSPFNLAAVRVGDYVEVRGTASGATGIAATLLERNDVDVKRLLMGAVSAQAAPNFTMLGVTIQTNSNTNFNFSGGSSATFFVPATIGRIFEVEGTQSGAFLIATKISPAS